MGELYVDHPIDGSSNLHGLYLKESQRRLLGTGKIFLEPDTLFGLGVVIDTPPRTLLTFLAVWWEEEWYRQGGESLALACFRALPKVKATAFPLIDEVEAEVWEEELKEDIG